MWCRLRVSGSVLARATRCNRSGSKFDVVAHATNGSAGYARFMASLIAFAVLSMLVDNGAATRGAISGIVTEVRPGEWITVSSARTDPRGVQIALRNTTVCEDAECDATLRPETIKPGVRVTVWYRSVGERRLVADKVRVLLDAQH
jgi:hypothetical protein